MAIGSKYIGNIINYLFYLPGPFPRGLEVDLEGAVHFYTYLIDVH